LLPFGQGVGVLETNGQILAFVTVKAPFKREIERFR
jgi:hypothetical protein